MGLLDAEDFSGFGLGKGTALNESVNLQRQLCFQEFLFRVGKAEVGEDVPAAFFTRTGFLVLVVMLVVPFSV